MSTKEIEGICHICGRHAKLSFEHIPPRHAFNSHKAIIYNGKEMIKKHNGEKAKYSIMQKGMGKYTLCESCNNLMGKWYAKEYGRFAISVANDLHNREQLTHGTQIEYHFKDVYPLRFIKQVVSMFCSLIPYEEVQRLGFNRLLLNPKSNSVDLSLFDLRMYLTPINTGQITSGIVIPLIKRGNNDIDYVVAVDMCVYPFGFILNLSPGKDFNYGVSINSMFNSEYEDIYDAFIPLTYIERYNEKCPMPLCFKSL